MNSKKKAIKYLALLCILSFVGFAFMYHYTLRDIEEEHIIYITKNMDSTFEFWNDIKKGAELAAKEYGVKLSIRGIEKETDYEGQNQLILDAVEEKPDAIILAAADYYKTCSAARAIKENNIQLVLIDSKLKEDIASSIISTDNFQAGIKMGAIVQSLTNSGNKVGIVSYVKESSTAIEREEGLRTALNNIEERIEETVYCDSDYDKGVEVTKELLSKKKGITVIAALNQYAAVGAARAVIELELEGKVKIIGFDNALEEIKYLEAGILEAIVIQKPFNMGYLSVENAVKLVRKESVPLVVDSGSVLITKENMNSEMNQKLLFPFVND